MTRIYTLPPFGPNRCPLIVGVSTAVRPSDSGPLAGRVPETLVVRGALVRVVRFFISI